MSQELAVVEPAKPSGIARAERPRGLELKTMNDFWEFADIANRSGIAPKSLDTPDKVFLALVGGAELGFTPMQSLQNIGIVNGKTTCYGDALPALVMGSGLCEVFEEWFEVDGEPVDGAPWHRLSDFPDGFTAVVCIRRRGRKTERVQKFSVADAKRAGLWGKGGPWSQYPQRMLRFRALSWAVRDEFPDVTRGMVAYEEAQDFEVEKPSAPVESARTRPTPRPLAQQAAPSTGEEGQDVFAVLDETIDELYARYEVLKAQGGKDGENKAEYAAVCVELKKRADRGEKPTPKPKKEEKPKEEAAPQSPFQKRFEEAKTVTPEEEAKIERIFGDGDDAIEGEVTEPEARALPSAGDTDEVVARSDKALEQMRESDDDFIAESDALPLTAQQKTGIAALAKKFYGKENWEKHLNAALHQQFGKTLDELTQPQASDTLLMLREKTNPQS